MTITLPAAVLRAAFAVLSKAINSKTTLPVLNYLHIERAGRFVRLTATDLDRHLTFSHPLEAEPLTPLGRKLAETRWKREAGALLVPRDTMRDALKGVREGDITLSENAVAYPLAGQTVSVNFTPIAADEFPPAAEVKCANWNRFNPEARAAVLAALPSVSSDETRYVLNGALIEGDYNDQPVPARIVTTDGRRLTTQPLADLGSIGANLIVPTGALRLLTTPALLAHDWFLYFDPWKPADPDHDRKEQSGVARFIAGPWTLTTKLIEGNFPNYRQIVPTDFRHHLTLALPAAAHGALLAILRQLPKVESGKEALRLNLHGPHLEVRCEASGFTAIVPAASDAPLSIAFNRHFLREALALGPGTFRLLDAMSPGVYLRAGGASVVLMPMRSDSTHTLPDPQREALEADWKGREVLVEGVRVTVDSVEREGLSFFARLGADRIPLAQLEPAPVIEAAPAKARRKRAA